MISWFAGGASLYYLVNEIAIKGRATNEFPQRASYSSSVVHIPQACFIFLKRAKHAA